MADAPVSPRAARRAKILLAIGAATGVVLAATGVVNPSADDLPPGVVARVNGRVITTDEYHRAVERLAADARNELTEAHRAHVLNRLIEEELLIQRGVEIGLVGSDRSVRSAIAGSMIDAIVTEASSAQPTRPELREFFLENRGFFARTLRLRVQEIVFRGEDAAERAALASAALDAETPFDTVRERHGDVPISPIPDVLLPPQKLREYIGPSLVTAASRMAPGDVSAPVRGPSGLTVLRLVDAVPEDVPPLEDILPQVEAEYTRRAGDRALRDYLDQLRADADVALSPDAPQ